MRRRTFEHAAIRNEAMRCARDLRKLGAESIRMRDVLLVWAGLAYAYRRRPARRMEMPA